MEFSPIDMHTSRPRGQSILPFNTKQPPWGPVFSARENSPINNMPNAHLMNGHPTLINGCSQQGPTVRLTLKQIPSTHVYYYYYY